MTARAPRRPGLSLLEMSGVMAVLGVVLLLGTAVLVSGLQANRAALRADVRATQRAAVADAFRADVAAAEAAPDRFADYSAGPECVILRRPDGAHVVYRFAGGGLTRAEAEGANTRSRPCPLGAEGTQAAFARTAGDRPLVTLALTDTPRHGPAKRSEISAALGGDLR